MAGCVLLEDIERQISALDDLRESQRIPSRIQSRPGAQEAVKAEPTSEIPKSTSRIVDMDYFQAATISG